MSRFKRLTGAEARTLTRRELLDRVEAEQAYWFRKKTRTADDDAAFGEFTRIMYAYLSPASVAEAIQDTIDYIEGRSSGSDWDTRSGRGPGAQLRPKAADWADVTTDGRRSTLPAGLRIHVRPRC